MKVFFHPHPDHVKENEMILMELSKVPGIIIEQMDGPGRFDRPWVRVDGPADESFYGLSSVYWLVKERLDETEPLDQLRALLDQLPEKMRVDWSGTNHYEVHDATPGAESWWWLQIPDIFAGWPEKAEDWQATVQGRRLGLILDIAAKVKELWPLIQQLRDAKKNRPDADSHGR